MVFDEDYDYCWLIDIGDYHKVAELLPKDVEIRGVFLTHSHFDHIYGMNDLHKAFPSCRVYTSAYGRMAIYDDKKNFSRYHEHPIVFEGKHLEVVGEGDEIPMMGEQKIKVAATPGHEPGCLTFYMGDYIFTGDAYIPGVKVVTKLPGGDRALAAESVEKILRLAEGKTICPGHGEMV